MRQRNLTLATAVALALAALPAAAVAQDSYGSVESWTEAFTDPGWGNAWSDPEKFTEYMKMMADPEMMASMMQMTSPTALTQWLEVMTNPEMVTSMTSLADTEALTQWLGVMTDPDLMIAMAKLADPTPYMEWMTDPAMITAMAKMGDPTPYMAMLTNPDYIKALVSFSDPAMLNPWINMMTDIKLMDTMARALNPQLMASMSMSMMQVMGATGNPITTLIPKADGGDQ